MEERRFTLKLLESEQMLYRIACVLLRSETDRQDAMQETALKAWQNQGQLREEWYFKTWVSRIMVNECHNLHRKNSRWIPMEELPDRPAPENGAARWAPATAANASAPTTTRRAGSRTTGSA